MIFAVDFDGTCVTYEFPKVGKNIGAGPVLRLLISKGHKIILHTMRDDVEKEFPGVGIINTQKEAEEWFKKENIPLFGINYNPDQERWTKSKKVFAHYYIDDQALGTLKLTWNNSKSGKFINWLKVAQDLEYLDIISFDEFGPLIKEINKELNWMKHE